MPIGTPSIVAAAYSTTDTTSYTTATLSPALIAGRVLIAFSDTSIGAGESPGVSLSTSSLVSWTRWIAQGHPTTVRRIFADTVACGPSPSATTTITLTMVDLGSGTTSTGTGHAIVQVSGVRAAQPVVRAVSTNVNSTSITLTLPRPLSVANRWLVWCQHRANEVTTPRASPWAELSDVAGASPTRAGQVQWLPGVVTSTGTLEVSASASWTTSSQSSICALELQAVQPRTRRTRCGRR